MLAVQTVPTEEKAKEIMTAKIIVYWFGAWSESGGCCGGNTVCMVKALYACDLCGAVQKWSHLPARMLSIITQVRAGDQNPQGCPEGQINTPSATQLSIRSSFIYWLFLWDDHRLAPPLVHNFTAFMLNMTCPLQGGSAVDMRFTYVNTIQHIGRWVSVLHRDHYGFYVSHEIFKPFESKFLKRTFKRGAGSPKNLTCNCQDIL